MKLIKFTKLVLIVGTFGTLFTPLMAKKDHLATNIKKYTKHTKMTAHSRNSHTKSKDTIKIAKQFLGRKYRFGASTRTTKVFDCSSFVKKVMKLAKNKNIPRTASSQYKHAKKVKNPKKGDLVFFKGTYKKGISHVGIMISKNKFIHASSGAGKVTISSLNKSYYKKHLKGFARV